MQDVSDFRRSSAVHRRSQIAVSLLAAMIWMGSVSPASAQIAISRSPTSGPNLGRVVRGSTQSVFAVDTSGGVTRTSGTAIRVDNGAVTVPTIRVTCGSTNTNCRTRDVRILVQATGASDDATISRFRIGSLTGGTYRTSAPADGTTLQFDLRPLGSFGAVTFPLGMDLILGAGADAAPDTFTYTVTATFR